MVFNFIRKGNPFLNQKLFAKKILHEINTLITEKIQPTSAKWTLLSLRKSDVISRPLQRVVADNLIPYSHLLEDKNRLYLGLISSHDSSFIGLAANDANNLLNSNTPSDIHSSLLFTIKFLPFMIDDGMKVMCSHAYSSPQLFLDILCHLNTKNYSHNVSPLCKSFIEGFLLSILSTPEDLLFKSCSVNPNPLLQYIHAIIAAVHIGMLNCDEDLVPILNHAARVAARLANKSPSRPSNFGNEKEDLTSPIYLCYKEFVSSSLRTEQVLWLTASFFNLSVHDLLLRGGFASGITNIFSCLLEHNARDNMVATINNILVSELIEAEQENSSRYFSNKLANHLLKNLAKDIEHTNYLSTIPQGRKILLENTMKNELQWPVNEETLHLFPLLDLKGANHNYLMHQILSEDCELWNKMMNGELLSASENPKIHEVPILEVASETSKIPESWKALKVSCLSSNGPRNWTKIMLCDNSMAYTRQVEVPIPDDMIMRMLESGFIKSDDNISSFTEDEKNTLRYNTAECFINDIGNRKEFLVEAMIAATDEFFGMTKLKISNKKGTIAAVPATKFEWLSNPESRCLVLKMKM